MQLALVPPNVPFAAPAGWEWALADLENMPTPVLFKAGETGRALSNREQQVLRRLYIFYLDCMDLNLVSRARRARGEGPSENWRTLMRAVGHDEENQDHLWYLKQHWEIKFTPLCWLRAGDDVSEKRWWEFAYTHF